MARKSAKQVKYWRDAFGPNEVVQRIRPDYTAAYLPNPHRGTTTFQRFQGDPLYPNLNWNDAVGPMKFKPAPKQLKKNLRYAPWTTIAYCRWEWNLLEPEKGKIRYDLIDGALNSAMQHKQTLQLLMEPYVRPECIAPWYWATGAKPDPNVRGQRVPDHNDPHYVKHWGDFIRALGKRYDGHPALESFDIGYGGGCGESGGNSTPETAVKLVDIYLNSFKKTQLLGMGGTPGSDYAMTVPGRGVGWRMNCYGDVHQDGAGVVPDHLCWNHTYDYNPQLLENPDMRERWKTAPVIFETCWTVGYWWTRKWDIDFIIEHGYKYHISVFMPKSVWYPEQWMDKMDAFDKKIGYRFFLHQMLIPLEAKPGQEIEAQVVIDNKGIAPIYRPYHFALRFMQGKTAYVVRFKNDIRKWMPDLTFFREKIQFPRQLKEGEVRVSCGIVNDEDKPVVRFAIKDVEPDGWHPLTSMDVLKN